MAGEVKNSQAVILWAIRTDLTVFRSGKEEKIVRYGLYCRHCGSVYREKPLRRHEGVLRSGQCCGVAYEGCGEGIRNGY